MTFSFDDLVKKTKQVPLEKQKGARFDPPKKELKGTAKKKKIEVKENPDRKQELEDFKEEMGIKEKDMAIKFIDDCIDEVDAMRLKLSTIKDKAKKHFKIK